MKNIYKKLTALGLFIFILSGAAMAEEVNLEKIVVTPYRYAQTLSKTASSVTVITRKDIESSNANTVLDTLKSIPGVTVRDYYGTGAKASVDLRGFGEQGGMNVLVLIDGRRANEIDLSAADWTQIPLNQIEKIEVIRGPGSVLYGDNAVSGVINIITKKGKGKPRLELENQVGSYDMNKQILALGGSEDRLSYRLTASREGTHGYRKNSYYKAEDFGSNLAYEIDQDSSLRFSNGFHSSSYGIPGPLSSADLETLGRKGSKYGDDHANDKDYYFKAGGEKKFGGLGALDIDFAFRRREVDTFFLTSYTTNPIYKNRIDTFSVTPKYVMDGDILKHNNKLVLGVDYYNSDYMSDNYSSSDSLQNFTDINKISTGYYLQDEFSIFKKLTLLGGYRYEEAKYEFDYHDNSGANADIDTNLKPKKKAFNLGLLYSYLEDSKLFINTSRSFRFPATDEYYSVWGVPPVNISLKPQTARHYEIGAEHKFNDSLKLNLTIFRMNIENELYYNPLTFANENYDKTRHDGLELALESKITKNIGFFSSYAYTKSTFLGGSYDKNDVPMVSRHKGSMGLRFLILRDITLNILGNYTGKRYFINDQANSFSRLNGYFIAGMNITYRYKDFTLSGGIDNIFDKKYSEYAVCNSTSGAKNYYPNPGRNLSLKLGYKF